MHLPNKRRSRSAHALRVSIPASILARGCLPAEPSPCASAAPGRCANGRRRSDHALRISWNERVRLEDEAMHERGGDDLRIVHRESDEESRSPASSGGNASRDNDRSFVPSRARCAGSHGTRPGRPSGRRFEALGDGVSQRPSQRLPDHQNGQSLECSIGGTRTGPDRVLKTRSGPSVAGNRTEGQCRHGGGAGRHCPLPRKEAGAPRDRRRRSLRSRANRGGRELGSSATILRPAGNAGGPYPHGERLGHVRARSDCCLGCSRRTPPHRDDDHLLRLAT